MVGLPRTPGIWQAVVEAHERELMMQRDRDLAGRPVGVTPAELMARQLRMMEAMSASVPVHPQRTEIEDAIRAYARKLIKQRAAVVKDARLWDQARALLVRAGAEPPR